MYSDFLALAAEISGGFLVFVALIKGLGTSSNAEESRLPLLLLFVSCFLAFLFSLLPHFIDSWRILNGIASILHLVGGGIFVHFIGEELKQNGNLSMHKTVLWNVAIFIIPAFTVMSLDGANAIGYLADYGETVFAITVFYFLIFAASLFGSFIFITSQNSREHT